MTPMMDVIFVLGVFIAFISVMYAKLMIRYRESLSQIQTYEQIFDQFPVGLSIYDANGKLVMINKFLKEKCKSQQLLPFQTTLNFNSVKDSAHADDPQTIFNLGTYKFSVALFFQVIKNRPLHFAYFIPIFSAETVEIDAPPQPMNYLREMGLGLAHHLKNPITSIKMLLQMANPQSFQDFTQQFKTILAFELERLDKIIGDFMHFSDPGTLEFETYNIIEILAEVEQIIHENYQGRNFKIKKELFPVPKRPLDRKKMIQVFLNLIVNAIEALPDYGGLIQIKTKKNKDQIEIQIIDDGTGIKEADKPKIFLPFFSTKQEGTGLGLAITQKIIHQHGGEISFQSKAGVNTTFKVTLPVIKHGQE